MNAAAREWLEEACERTTAIGRSRVLTTVLGRVQVVDDHYQPPRVSWPSADIHHTSCATPFASFVITRHAASREIIELVNGPRAAVSRTQGRGAFPMRWVVGSPWVARYENGPVVLRDGNRLLMTAATLTEADTWADRVLREVLIGGGRQQGFAVCHGAVVAGDGGGGLLITGPSGAGKTDLALKLARNVHARIVTIDRGIIGNRTSGLAVGALPFGLNIHRRTLADLNCLDASLVDRYPLSNNKHYLSVHDVERHCQVKLAASAAVTAVVRIRQAQKDSWWERLDDLEIADAVRAADITATDPGFQNDWLGMAAGASAPCIEPGGRTTGWNLAYDPRRPLPTEWTEEAARALHATQGTMVDLDHRKAIRSDDQVQHRMLGAQP